MEASASPDVYIEQAIVSRNVNYLKTREQEVLLSKFFQFYMAISSPVVHRFFFTQKTVLKNEFFAYCKDAETMLYALEQHRIEADVTNLTESFCFYIIQNRLDVLKKLLGACTEFQKKKLDIERMFLTAVKCWNKEVFQWLCVIKPNGDTYQLFHKLCVQICEMELCKTKLVVDLTIFAIVLDELNVRNQGVQHFVQYFELLVDSDAKLQQLVFFLEKLSFQKDFARKVDVSQTPLVELTLLRHKIPTFKNSTKLQETVFLNSPLKEYTQHLQRVKGQWTFQMYVGLFNRERYEDLVTLVKLPTDETTRLSCLIFATREKRLDLVGHLLDSSPGDTMKRGFNECGHFLDGLRGPDFFAALQQHVRTYKELQSKIKELYLQ
jgi:hypothetical protein